MYIYLSNYLSVYLSVYLYSYKSTIGERLALFGQGSNEVSASPLKIYFVVGVGVASLLQPQAPYRLDPALSHLEPQPPRQKHRELNESTVGASTMTKIMASGFVIKLRYYIPQTILVLHTSNSLKFAMVLFTSSRRQHEIGSDLGHTGVSDNQGP